MDTYHLSQAGMLVDLLPLRLIPRHFSPHFSPLISPLISLQGALQCVRAQQTVTQRLVPRLLRSFLVILLLGIYWQDIAFHINFYRNGELITDPSTSPDFKRYSWVHNKCWADHSFSEHELTSIVSDLVRSPLPFFWFFLLSHCQLNAYGSESDKCNLMHVCGPPERVTTHKSMPTHPHSIRSAS